MINYMIRYIYGTCSTYEAFCKFSCLIYGLGPLESLWINHWISRFFFFFQLENCCKVQYLEVGHYCHQLVFSIDFSFTKPDVLEFIWILRDRNELKIQYLPHFESKSYQINSIKSCASRSFQEPKAHSNSSEFFSYDLFQFSVEEIIQYSRTFAPQAQTPWNEAHAPILVESFPTTPKEHNLKHLSLVDVIITKNKTIYLPS